MSNTSKSIGVATKDEQGVVTLLLRAEGPNGICGDAIFTYQPSDPKYQKIIDHVGGLEAGEEKLVPPWS